MMGGANARRAISTRITAVCRTRRAVHLATASQNMDIANLRRRPIAVGIAGMMVELAQECARRAISTRITVVCRYIAVVTARVRANVRRAISTRIAAVCRFIPVARVRANVLPATNMKTKDVSLSGARNRTDLQIP
jgi:hypothetical protein